MKTKHTEQSDRAACKTAQQLLKRILSGEATAAERNRFTSHLEACKRCRKHFGKTIDLAHKLKYALYYTTQEIKPTGSLPLNERTMPHPSLQNRYRAILDLVILSILGIGFMLLISLILVTYRQLRNEYQMIKRFQANQDVVILSHCSNKIAGEDAAMPLQEIKHRLGSRYEALLHRQAEPGSAFIDPWNSPYLFSKQDGGVVVYSSGPNKKDEGGSGDDITINTPPPSLINLSKGRRGPAP